MSTWERRLPLYEARCTGRYGLWPGDKVCPERSTCERHLDLGRGGNETVSIWAGVDNCQDKIPAINAEGGQTVDKK